MLNNTKHSIFRDQIYLFIFSLYLFIYLFVYILFIFFIELVITKEV
jgi:hypothetical protein